MSVGETPARNRRIILLVVSILGLSAILASSLYFIREFYKCKIFDGRYCDGWTVVQDSEGHKFFAFNLPVGTKILSPFDGDLLTGTNLDWEWDDEKNWIVLENSPSGKVDEKTIGFSAFGAISFTSSMSNKHIKRGYIVAEIVEGPPVVSNYNLLVMFTRYDADVKSLVYDEELSQKFFK
jgi:hypothetical protein